MSHRPFPTFGLLLFAVAFLGAGIASGFLLGAKALKDLQARYGWPEVEATVLATEVVVIGPGSHSARTGTMRPEFEYHPMVTIRYEAGVRTREARCYDAFLTSSTSRGAEQAKLAPFPVGGKVRAWVNPDDPNEAVVRTGGMALVVGITVPVLFLVVGGFAMVALIRRWMS
ncbi:MAG: DUF3592 domain-containing protein [Candidatus Sumerlaeia bacterium]|nr:DUF3592 domain-containing protein [Candidatus Sumerlaeia bacterium]